MVPGQLFWALLHIVYHLLWECVACTSPSQKNQPLSVECVSVWPSSSWNITVWCEPASSSNRQTTSWTKALPDKQMMLPLFLCGSTVSFVVLIPLTNPVLGATWVQTGERKRCCVFLMSFFQWFFSWKPELTFPQRRFYFHDLCLLVLCTRPLWHPLRDDLFTFNLSGVRYIIYIYLVLNTWWMTRSEQRLHVLPSTSFVWITTGVNYPA